MTETPENQAELMSYARELQAKLIRHIYMDEDINERVRNFQRELQAKYPDAKEYELYHLMIGSTLKNPSDKFDFPGEDSVLKFMEKLAAEIESKNP